MKLFSPSNAIADDVFRYRFLFVNTNFRYNNCIASFVVLLNVFYEPFPYTYEEICKYVSITISSIYCYQYYDPSWAHEHSKANLYELEIK